MRAHETFKVISAILASRSFRPHCINWHWTPAYINLPVLAGRKFISGSILISSQLQSLIKIKHVSLFHIANDVEPLRPECVLHGRCAEPLLRAHYTAPHRTPAGCRASRRPWGLDRIITPNIFRHINYSTKAKDPLDEMQMLAGYCE